MWLDLLWGVPVALLILYLGIALSEMGRATHAPLPRWLEPGRIMWIALLVGLFVWGLGFVAIEAGREIRGALFGADIEREERTP